MREWNLKATNYGHPTITTGQHTNGPARIWVEIDGIWYNTGSSKKHKVLDELNENGPERIINCTWNEYERKVVSD
jgi:hypothetical protein